MRLDDPVEDSVSDVVPDVVFAEAASVHRRDEELEKV